VSNQNKLRVFRKVLNLSPYFLEFASSRAASVSSRIINGGGLTAEIANKRAMELKALLLQKAS
jgi:hypothetical protein